jgi:hypothetical protein
MKLHEVVSLLKELRLLSETQIGTSMIRHCPVILLRWPQLQMLKNKK